MRSNKVRSSKVFLSLVIPAYKAEKVIEDTLLRAKKVLDESKYSYEVICVVDGRVDKTFENASKIAQKYPKKIKVVGYLTNLGKGHATRYGMARAEGDIVGYIDEGFDINPQGISLLLEHLKWYDADIIVGSKRHPASKVVYSWERRVLSFGYQILARVLFGLKIRDTQVGLKFFKRKVLERVLPRLLVKEYAFDIEILSVSYHLGFKKIYEGPVDISLQFGGSTVVRKGFIKTVSKTLRDTFAVFYRLKILRYYDSKNRKNWITPDYLTLGKK